MPPDHGCATGLRATERLVPVKNDRGAARAKPPDQRNDALAVRSMEAALITGPLLARTAAPVVCWTDASTRAYHSNSGGGGGGGSGGGSSSSPGQHNSVNTSEQPASQPASQARQASQASRAIGNALQNVCGSPPQPAAIFCVANGQRPSSLTVDSHA
eukprot:COSAG06_NODE_20922_length_776_cov_1.059084_1_plen_158_part_00